WRPTAICLTWRPGSDQNASPVAFGDQFGSDQFQEPAQPAPSTRVGVASPVFTSARAAPDQCLDMARPNVPVRGGAQDLPGSNPGDDLATTTLGRPVRPTHPTGPDLHAFTAPHVGRAA